MAKVAVYEFVAADGTKLGCGTALELDYWKSQGVGSVDDRLGDILGYEDARADELRKAAWAKDAQRQPLAELLA